MNCKLILLFYLTIIAGTTSYGQNPPWERPLKCAWSTDGINFSDPSVYQDSAGVPCIIKWKGDTVVCVFQWFRQPLGSPTWDRVAVKFSYDIAQSWTEPVPIVVDGLPAGYQRPFDPALAVLPDTRLRIYFSSSENMPQGGLDSTINTYSAVSSDGIHYTFEPGARVDELHDKVIDPAVVCFYPGWHYASPVGAPQDGAYHYVSPDGFNFSKVVNIMSDNQHNWTGNYMVNTPSELRFYGTGVPYIWYNSSANGGVWNGYVNTNINGGDPGVVLVSPGNYFMVYTGQSYATGIVHSQTENEILVVPNPVSGVLTILNFHCPEHCTFIIFSPDGKIRMQGSLSTDKIDTGKLPPGYYFLELINPNDSKKKRTLKFLKV